MDAVDAVDAAQDAGVGVKVSPIDVRDRWDRNSGCCRWDVASSLSLIPGITLSPIDYHS